MKELTITNFESTNENILQKPLCFEIFLFSHKFVLPDLLENLLLSSYSGGQKKGRIDRDCNNFFLLIKIIPNFINTY